MTGSESNAFPGAAVSCAVVRGGRLLMVRAPAPLHFVVVMRMAWETGEPVAGDDASETRWMELEALTAAGDGGCATAARLPGAGKQR